MEKLLTCSSAPPTESLVVVWGRQRQGKLQGDERRGNPVPLSVWFRSWSEAQSHTITHTHSNSYTHTGWQKRSTKGCNNDYVKIKYTRISFQLSLHVFTVERLQWNRIESMNTSFFPRLLVKLATRRYRKRQHIISVLMLQFYATIAEKQQISLLKVEYHLTQLLSRKGYVNACAVNV